MGGGTSAFRRIPQRAPTSENVGMDQLTALWGRLRATPRRRAVVDAGAVLAVGLLVLALGFGGMMTDAGWIDAPHWWHAVLLLAGCALMLVKFDAPVAALAGGAAVFAADLLIGGSIGVMLVLIDLLYTLALVGSAKALRHLITGVALAVGLLTVLGWVLLAGPRGAVFLGLQSFAVLGTPLWWGRSVRQQRELAELAAVRAEDQIRLARMRHEEAARDEREQMARDLHDAVAGHLSAIALRTEAALVAGPTPAEAETLTSVRSFSLEALTEMRTMIELLRGTEPQRAPSRLSDRAARDRLVGEHDATITCPDLPPLGTGVDQAGYRILQEALTNATKHGRAPTSVTVTTESGTLQIEVSNAVEQVLPLSDGGARRPLPAHQGSGLGVAIMTERARAVGGELSAGQDGDRWLVLARLPVPAAVHPQEGR